MEKRLPILRSTDSVIEQEFGSVRDLFEEEMQRMDLEMTRFREQMLQSQSAGGRSSSKTSVVSSSKTCRTLATSRMSSSSSSSTTTTTTTRSSASQQRQASSLTSTHVESNDNQHPGPHSAFCEHTKGSAESGQSDQQVHPARPSTESACHQDELAQATAPDARLDTAASVIDQSEDAGLALDEPQTSPQTCWLDRFGPDSPMIVQGLDGSRCLKFRFDVSAYEPEQVVVKTMENWLQVYAKRADQFANKSSSSEYRRDFQLPEGTKPELIKSALSADGVLTIEAPLPAPSDRPRGGR